MVKVKTNEELSGKIQKVKINKQEKLELIGKL